jgi:carbohydrate-selective porin OprB
VQLAANEHVVKSETVFELTYRAKVSEWLNIQPEVQYTRTQSNPSKDNDLIVGVRFEIKWSH